MSTQSFIAECKYQWHIPVDSTGIWVWGTPVELVVNGVKTSVFYLDTEGFESIGKSNVYDDRWSSSDNLDLIVPFKGI